jgi:hypothetical protein
MELYGSVTGGSGRGFGPISTCANCGAPALTTQQYVAAAKKLGFSVDPVSGAAAYSPAPPLLSGPGALPQTEAERQLQYEVIEGRRGYVCMACGNVHCASCLAYSPRSSATLGPRCPSCEEGPHGLLEG